MMRITPFILPFLARRTEAAIVFDEALSASTVLSLQSLLKAPWSTIGVLAAAFSSGEVSTPGYTGSSVSDLVDYNATQRTLWADLKPTTETKDVIVEEAYVGLANGDFIGYYMRRDKTPKRPLMLQEVSRSTPGCPKFPTSLCRRAYFNRTDPVTGRPTDEPNPESYSKYDCRTRPWYVLAVKTGDAVEYSSGIRHFGTYGAGWVPIWRLSTSDDLVVGVSRQLRAKNGVFVGVAAAIVFISTLNKYLYQSILGSAALQVVMVVLDEEARVVATSRKGLNEVKGLPTLTYAVNVSYSPIAFTTREILRLGGLSSFDKETHVLVEPKLGFLYWYQLLPLTDQFGLEWHLLTVQLLECEKGYFTNPTPDFKKCSLCPEGATCLGGVHLPKPASGFWIDRSRLEFLSTVYFCPYNTCEGFLSSSDEASCWTISSFNQSQTAKCYSDSLMCTPGSYGPLCANCKNGYYINSGAQGCVRCEGAAAGTSTVLAIVIALTVATYSFAKLTPSERFKTSALWPCILYVSKCMSGLQNVIDTSLLKVCWTTFQIVNTVGWSLKVSYPEPFATMVTVFSFTRLDFSTTQCFFKDSLYTNRSLTMSIAPIVVIAISSLILALRLLVLQKLGRPISPERSAKLLRNQLSFSLLVGYLVLPTVSQMQFAALNCVSVSGQRLLYRNTVENCDSPHYKQFVAANAFFIAVYQSVPLLWYLLLWRNRDALDNAAAHGSYDLQKIDSASEVSYIVFLWRDYKPDMRYFEVYEVYRRILFICAFELLAHDDMFRSSIGCLVSLLMIAVAHVTAPYCRDVTNQIYTLAQYQIFLTCFCGFLLSSGALLIYGLPAFSLGCLLIGINSIIIVATAALLVLRWRVDNAKRRWRKSFSDEELQLIYNGLLGSKNESLKAAQEEVGVELVSRGGKLPQPPRNSPKFDVDSSSIVLSKRIGSGSFGDVFKGEYKGNVVAVKTLRDLSEESLQSFREEIYLSSSLKHPNIIGFVGAALGQSLVCLCLEWAARGSLDDMLSDRKLDLRWEDPLLRLAMDAARGLVYLHGHKHFDAETGSMKECVVHRDVKPGNILITSYVSGKLSDFGCAKEKGEKGQSLQTMVGTPFFSAPEIVRGDSYTEKVDVYAFGLTLLNMAIEDPVLDFVQRRWAEDHRSNAKPTAKLPSITRVLWSMQSGWRPVTHEIPVPDIPPLLNSLIIHCCDADPLRRLSMREALVALEEIQNALNKSERSSRRHTSVATIMDTRGSEARIRESRIHLFSGGGGRTSTTTRESTTTKTSTIANPFSILGRRTSATAGTSTTTKTSTTVSPFSIFGKRTSATAETSTATKTSTTASPFSIFGRRTSATARPSTATKTSTTVNPFSIISTTHDDIHDATHDDISRASKEPDEVNFSEVYPSAH